MCMCMRVCVCACMRVCACAYVCVFHARMYACLCICVFLSICVYARATNNVPNGSCILARPDHPPTRRCSRWGGFPTRVARAVAVGVASPLLTTWLLTWPALHATVPNEKTVTGDEGQTTFNQFICCKRTDIEMRPEPIQYPLLHFTEKPNVLFLFSTNTQS